MTAGADVQAYGGQYLSTTDANAGTAKWTFSVPRDGSYFVWCRILSNSTLTDSFFVKPNGENEDVYDDSEDTWSPKWQWTVLNGRDGTGVPLTLDPRMVAMTAGTNTLKFRGREVDSRVDRVLITDDPDFVPTEGDVSTFADVAPSNPFYDFIETIARNGITTGCGSGDYCPQNGVTRAQMAVFPAQEQVWQRLRPPSSDRRRLRRRGREQLRGGLDRRALGRRRHGGLRRRPVLPRRGRHASPDGRLPAARRARVGVRASPSDGHLRRSLAGRPVHALDRGALHRGRHGRMRKRKLLPQRSERAAGDGGLSREDLQALLTAAARLASPLRAPPPISCICEYPSTTRSARRLRPYFASRLET